MKTGHKESTNKSKSKSKKEHSWIHLHLRQRNSQRSCSKKQVQQLISLFIVEVYLCFLFGEVGECIIHHSPRFFFKKKEGKKIKRRREFELNNRQWKIATQSYFAQKKDKSVWESWHGLPQKFTFLLKSKHLWRSPWLFIAHFSPTYFS